MARRAALGRGAAAAACFVLVVLVLGAVQLWVAKPMLLAERFAAGAAWIEIALLAGYAAALTHRLLDPVQAPRWRLRAWMLFSMVFFGQLALGLLGSERCLMTPGKLHWPIPALIVAGPVYRGGGFFMATLFVVTVVLVGPAWCSQLCYLGAWDGWAAQNRRRPGALPRWGFRVHLGILVVVVGVALALRLLGAPPALAGALALAFGLGGVVVMATLSRQRGTMVHCVVYCPIGLLAVLLGKLSPFRFRLGAGCDGCGRCRLACRYGALTAEDIVRRRPGLTCTLCGDCVGSCPDGFAQYRCLGLGPTSARTLFVVLTVTLHAATVGLARI